ncbi:hypothetical protein JCM10296v2_006527 [Rhodotorula toruloides]
MASVNDADPRTSWRRTPAAEAFRKGVVQILGQGWWEANFTTCEHKYRAYAVRDRLERDLRAVHDAWVQRCEAGHQTPFLQVFCETLLGSAVYDGVVQPGIDAESILSTLGAVYGALLQSIAMENRVVEAPAGFSFVNGELISTCKKYLLLPIEAIFDILKHSHHPRTFAPADLARAFCYRVEAAFSKHDWDDFGLAASYAIGERLQADHARVAAVLGHQLTDKVLFTALLGTTVCEVLPLNSEGNVRKLGELYGALLKSVAYPEHAVHAPGGFSYHNMRRNLLSSDVSS